MFSEDVTSGIAGAAREAGIDPAALLAVAEVESGGQAFALVDGRNEPLIRFEGHYFDRRLSDADRATARAQGLASPVAGAVPNPPTQAARWRLLERAVAIDAAAAYESVSWGLGQVMGAHWALLGYADVGALVMEARSGAAGQARLMALYIGKAGLASALATGDWQAFARGYNGPAYAQNAYDTKIAAAYRRYAEEAEAAPATEAAGGTLQQGARGPAVEDLQRQLSALGYAVAVDGIFGPATRDGVRRFQSDRHLAVDGIAGPKTVDMLADVLAPRTLARRLWAALKTAWARLVAAVGG